MLKLSDEQSKMRRQLPDRPARLRTGGRADAGSIRAEQSRIAGQLVDAANVCDIRLGDQPDIVVPALVAIAQQSPRSPHYYRKRKSEWLQEP